MFFNSQTPALSPLKSNDNLPTVNHFSVAQEKKQ